MHHALRIAQLSSIVTNSVLSRRLSLACVLFAIGCSEPLTHALAPVAAQRGWLPRQTVPMYDCGGYSMPSGCPLGVTVTPGYMLGRDQPGAITVTFDTPGLVKNVYIQGYGGFACSGTYGTLTAYAKTGRQLVSVPIQVDNNPNNPPRCDPPAENSIWLVAKLTATEPIAWIIITPMSPVVNYLTRDGYWNAPVQMYTVSIDQTYPPPAYLAFDAHPDTIKPSVYRLPPTSACLSGTSLPHHSWGLTLMQGYGADATPLSSETVALTLFVLDTSGHHLAHAAGRPVGSFEPGTTLVTSTTVTTDARGHASFNYYPAEFGGMYWVRAVRAGVAWDDFFTIGVPLLPVTGEDVNWIPYGEGRDKHRDVYFASENMRAAADSLARSYKAQFPGKRLYFNDMGLPLGGRFDVLGRWAADPDHCSHRWGNALDLRTNVLPLAEFKWVRSEWEDITGIVAPLFLRNHYHLQTPKEF